MARQIQAQPDKKTISDLIGKINRSELVLQPEFQRGFVWTPEHMENFIKTINEADENIKLAYQKKEKVIDDFLEEIKPICECFHSIWKNDEKLFKKELGKYQK